MSNSSVQTPDVVSTDARRGVKTNDGVKGIASPAAPEDFTPNDGSNNHASNPLSGQIVSAEQHRADEELTLLRSLLFSPEQTHLQHLQQRLDTLEVTAEDVAAVLPEAIKAQTTKGERLSISLTPLIERALRGWIKSNPQVFIDILFPLIGATIRRAISNALAEMLQSFNQTLEHSFSLQSLRWRLEAWRTGKPFAEVVLLHTLKYRVEQIFLIHRETGLLLQHVVSPALSSTQDGDMVSGMMTAINDFAHDAFHAEQSESLNSFQVGGLSVWIEQTPLATLAAVIRGNAPPELHVRLQQVLENIHERYRAELGNFQGDASIFDLTRPELEECLDARFGDAAEANEKQKRRTSPVLWLLGGVTLAALCLALWFVGGNIVNRVRWQRYLERLRAERGIVVTQDEKRDGKFIVAGLRDPLAVEPQTLLDGTGLDANKVVGNWKEYQSLDPNFVLARATQILAPPASAKLSFENSILTARGVAASQWIEDARRLARAIPGVAQYKDDELQAEKPPDVEVQTTPEQIPTPMRRKRFRRRRLRSKLQIAPSSNVENTGTRNQGVRNEQKLL